MDPRSYIGDTVELDCGEVGTYTGRVKRVNPEDQTITLYEILLNGKQWPVSDVTIKGEHVRDLKLIKKAKETIDEKHPVTKDAGDPDYYYKNKIQTPSGKYQPRSPEQQTYGNRRNVAKQGNFKERDQQCFGREAHSPTLPDFDFQKNLARFDKQAIFDDIKSKSMNSSEANQPVVINTLRGNENVLESEPVSLRQIKVPLEHVGKEYSTDYGFVVPAISLELRKRLFAAAERAGLSLHQRVENAGVCACQMALQLVGGSLRICPKNAHQAPEIVVLAGPHVEGMTALCAARHLANHTARVKLLCPERNVLLQKQLDLFMKSGGKIIKSVNDLPTQPVDLIIDALIGHDDPGLVYNWVPWAVQWANKKEAPILSIDPYIHPTSSDMTTSKWSLAMALPLISSPRSGRLFLADIGIPRGIFKETGISYVSPFGDKFVIPLYD